MMELLWSPRSPFVRKVMIVLHEGGLEERVKTQSFIVALPIPPVEEVLELNPLGKIPTLVCEDGTCLFDSRVICEYLDNMGGTELFPKDFAKRMKQLRWQALGDGLTDALLLWRTERSRGEKLNPDISDGFEVKVRYSMKVLEDEVSEFSLQEFGIGHIAIICALGQLDFRWPGTEWEAAFPNLAQWYRAMCQRPSVSANPIVSDDHNTSGDAPIFKFRKD